MSRNSQSPIISLGTFFKTIFRNIQESWDMQDEKQKQQQLLSISDASHSNLKCIFQLE